MPQEERPRQAAGATYCVHLESEQPQRKRAAINGCDVLVRRSIDAAEDTSELSDRASTVTRPFRRLPGREIAENRPRLHHSSAVRAEIRPRNGESLLSTHHHQEAPTLRDSSWQQPASRKQTGHGAALTSCDQDKYVFAGFSASMRRWGHMLLAAYAAMMKMTFFSLPSSRDVNVKHEKRVTQAFDGMACSRKWCDGPIPGSGLTMRRKMLT